MSRMDQREKQVGPERMEGPEGYAHKKDGRDKECQRTQEVRIATGIWGTGIVGCSLGSRWEPPGGAPGSSFEVSGWPFGVPLGASFGLLGGLWRRLRGFLGALWSLLGPPGEPLGPEGSIFQFVVPL